jgi:hypothetical protein
MINCDIRIPYTHEQSTVLIIARIHIWVYKIVAQCEPLNHVGTFAARGCAVDHIILISLTMMLVQLKTIHLQGPMYQRTIEN